MRSKTTIKSFRMPDTLISDIENTATEKKITFSEEAVYRMKHSDSKLTPEVMVRVQNVVNLSLEAAFTKSEDKAYEALEGVNELWKFLK